jgi:hypothetical protein
MALTRVERERLTDSRLKIQSVTKSLTHIDSKKIRDLDEIRQCLDAADRSIRGALRDPEGQGQG